MKRLWALFALVLSLGLGPMGPALAEDPNVAPLPTIEPVVRAKSTDASVAIEATGTMLSTLDADTLRKIEPALLKGWLDDKATGGYTITAQKAVTFLVFLAGEADLSDVSPASDPNAPATVVRRLQKVADEGLDAVTPSLNALRDAGHVDDYRSYWVFNGLAVDGDLASALALAKLDAVVAIRENGVHHLDDPQDDGLGALGDAGWNIEATGAPQVWSELGVTGRGVVVANMDSGVDWSHPALQPQYRGYPGAGGVVQHDYNWFDATGTYPTAPGPNVPDISQWSDHGTHTMGSLVGQEANGSNVIGMAPDARWIAAKVFDDQGDSTDEWLHAGFQWCLAPTDLQGNNPNPALAPDIVSNSWGDDNGLDDSFRHDLEAWRRAGIFSAWASGNAGPGVSTVGSPASYDIAFSVGAIDSDERIASFSSRGPSLWGGFLKPEVVAPGVNIRSSIAGGGYEGGWNGTSMATPHVAGLAALMLEAAQHSLTITETASVIIETARDLGVTGPDNNYGHGRIDAYQAVLTIFEGGAFAGRVTDAANGMPLAGARLRLVNQETQGETKTTTDAAGRYSASVAAGTYDVTVTAFGYQAEVVEDLAIYAGYTTQLAFALDRLPGGTITGKVTERDTGSLVSAEVTLVGTEQVVAVDAQGNYSLDVPIGDYVVRAMPLGAGHRGAESDSLTISQDVTVTADLRLAPMPRVLLVDADAWSPSGAVLRYYDADLDDLLIGHDVRSINAVPDAVPSADEMNDYSLVIWAQAVSHPGFVSAWGDLAAYTAQGGDLLISGQDIGYWANQEGDLDALRDVLHAEYVSENAGLLDLTAPMGSLFDGLTLEYNTDDSAGNQTAPDVVSPSDVLADVAWESAQGHCLGLQVTACDSRAIYLAFGLEGVGPRAQRQEILERAVTWLTATDTSAQAHMRADSFALTALPGAVRQFPLEFVNRGATAAEYDLELTAGEWPAEVIALGSSEPLAIRQTLAPCEVQSAVLNVTLPETAGIGTSNEITLALRSVASGQIEAELAFTAVAMPAWTPRADLLHGRYRAAAAVVGCKLYVIGGFDLDGNVVNTVQVYDAATDTWSTGPSLPCAAANVAVAVRGDLVYVVGGYDPDRDGAERLAALYALDTTTGLWRQLTSLPQAVSGMTAVALGDAIYALGGNTPTGDFAGSYIYDIGTDAWRDGPTIETTSTSFAQATVLDGAIYMLGGWPDGQSVARLDPGSGVWEHLAEMPTGRHSFALGNDGAYLYVAGGGVEWQGDGAAERYDPGTDTWLSLPGMRYGERVGACGAMLDGSLVVVGGTTAASGVSCEALGVRSLLSSSHWSVSEAYARPEQVLSYQLRLHNPERVMLTPGVAIVLPTGLDPVAGTIEGGLVYSASQHRLKWTGSLAAGATKILSFDAQVAASLASGTVLTATAAIGVQGCAFGSLSAVTEVSEPSLAASTKTVDQTETLPGAVLHYDILLANTSPFGIDAAALIDPIPVGAQLVGDTLVGADHNAGLNRIEWSGALDAAIMGDSRYEWIDATRGDNLGLGDDTCTDALPLGFDFTFYGQSYSQIYVSSNGLVLFEGGSTRYSNDAIPNGRAPNAYVAPFWDDLAPNSSGAGVYYLVTGESPNRKAIIEWYNVPVYGQSERLTFEAVLFEGSNRVVFQYASVAGERGIGNEATVGIENADGSEGIAYLYDGQPHDNLLHDRLAIEMVHSSAQLGSEHRVTYDVQLDVDLPPSTVITNTAFIDDGLRVHERTVQTTVRAPDLSQSTKSCSADGAVEGTLLDYTILVHNGADVAAPAFELEDLLPPELEYIAGSLTGGASYDPGRHAISWQGTLDSLGQFEIGYSARLSTGLAVNQRVTNTTTLSDRGVLLKTLNAVVVANPVDLTGSSLLADRINVPAGESLGYELTVRNDGLYTADMVQVTNTLPVELGLDVGSLSGASYDGGARQVTWSGSLAPGASHTITYQAMVSMVAMHNAEIVNACVISTVRQTISRSASINVLRCDLRASTFSAVPLRLDPGDPVTFTVRIANSGAYSTTATLHNEIPQGFTLEPATLYASDGQVAWDGQSVTWSGAVERQGVVVIRYSGWTGQGVGGVCLANQATLIDGDGVTYPLYVCALIDGNDAIRLPLIYNRYSVGGS